MDSPTSEEIEIAKKFPNGFVYRIDGNFAPEEAVPPEKIIGAWKVDSSGRIEGTFINNRNYCPQ